MANGSTLKAGAAKVDLTPDFAVPLGGYAERRGALSSGIHDRVYARALVLESGSEKVAVVSADLCFLPASIKIKVLKRLSKAWDAEHVFLAATHSHSAPDPLAMHQNNTFDFKGWTKFDPKLLDFTAERIVEAISAAEKRLVPARLGVRFGEGTGLNRNRRGGKTLDTAMTLLRVTDEQDKPIAAIVNFAAHPTLYGDVMREISADWPGVMTAEVEKTLGEESVCLFLNGAEGDATTLGADGSTEAERVVVYGKKVAARAKLLLDATDTQAEAPVAAWSQTVTLPPRKPNGLFLLAASQLGISVAKARGLVNGIMPEKTQVRFVQIGQLLLIGFPCEPTGEIGLAAKAAARKAGDGIPAVVALTDDWLGYALTPEEYRLGNYEASMSFYGDQLGPTLLAAVTGGLEAGKKERKSHDVGAGSRKSGAGRVGAGSGQ